VPSLPDAATHFAAQINRLGTGYPAIRTIVWKNGERSFYSKRHDDLWRD
jgi:hypothetical protein